MKKVIAVLLAVLMTVALCALVACDQNITVTFVLGNGEDNQVVSIAPGETVTMPQAPTRPGYIFTGWSTDENGRNEWDFSGIVKVELTLYAQWKADPTYHKDTITVAKALEIINGLEASKSTTERYYIRGTVSNLKDDYGSFDITDSTGKLYVYGSYSSDGETKWSAMPADQKFANGDTVLIYGTLQNYKGNTPEVHSAWIIAFSKKEPIKLPAEGSEITFQQAIEIAGQFEGNEKSPRYVLSGTVKSITNPSFGEMYLVDDEGTELYVYGSYDSKGEKRYSEMAEKPYKGDKVKVSAVVHTYNGKIELSSVRILSFEHVETQIDETKYQSMTIAQARSAAKEALVKVSGVVAAITYANGKIPSGFILVDNTSSIYVYDGDVTARVAVGNTVTIFASKTYWILDTEASSAAKYGYKGCCQLENAYLKDNDGKTTAFDTSWIEETTVKDIMDTPVTEDITSKVFKVTAYVRKSPGSGFTNYYIDDLDGKTGTYTYTQCNGSDFDWLDKYDGKICTVYVTAINAKSSASGCIWRFLPVSVSDDGFTFSEAYAPEFAVKYFVVDKIKTMYAADPKVKFITSYSNDDFNIDEVAISYTSSDNDVLYVEDGVLHTSGAGTATLTITATYKTHTYSKQIEITVKDVSATAYISIADAIAADIDSVVTVRGVVGPSLVNQVGFYLISEDGVIAVKVNSETMASVHIGDEVILKGTRVQYPSDKITDDFVGQACLLDSTIELNLYGDNEYCTDTFITDKTLDEIMDYSVAEDHTTEVYVLEATVKVVKTAYYTNVYLVSESNKELLLYCSSGTQYSFLNAYDGKKVTVELALCSWNQKTFYRGAVLAVYLEDGSVVYNELNFSK